MVIYFESNGNKYILSCVANGSCDLIVVSPPAMIYMGVDKHESEYQHSSSNTVESLLTNSLN